MPFRWRRVLLALVSIFIGLQFWALLQLDTDVLGSKDVRDAEPKHYEAKEDIKEPNPQRNSRKAELCEVTHKDAISAMSRASPACRQIINQAYCDNKKGQLLPAEIKRTCPKRRSVAQAPRVDTPDPNAKIRICYFLIVHGRSLRQIKRLVKLIYHSDHILYFHVDARSHWLFDQLKSISVEYSNIHIADWRETPIWGGTSLLTTIFRGLTDMVDKEFKWDFFINLSFADFPVATNDELVQFLYKYRTMNFMKSHGREPDKFITKQGLDRVFLECDNHMYRLTERTMPKGIEIDGGSDWLAINREFSEWLVFSKDENLEQLKVWFNYTLLPAESFFHTALQNTNWCHTFVDNNIRVTNWNRARGCKCQYKSIVDWCGCSPNDFMPKDLGRLKTQRPIFFARKFEEFVSQEAVNRVENEVYGEYAAGTPSLNYYWENIFNYDEVNDFSKSDSSRDGKRTFFDSWLRLATSKLAFLKDVNIFLDAATPEVGYVLSYSENGEEKESFVKRIPKEITADIDIPVNIEVGTNWDVKELVFRDPGGVITTLNPIHVSFRFKNIREKIKVVAVVQDPAGVPADQIDMDIPEDEEKRQARPKSSTFHCEGSIGGEVIAAEKLALTLPTRPGVWTVSVYIKGPRSTKYIEGSRTHFVVSPVALEFGRPIELNVEKVNGGTPVQHMNNKKKDLKIWNKIIQGTPSEKELEDFNTSLSRNSTLTGKQLTDWVDESITKGWEVVGTCTTNSLSALPDCHKTYWSTKYPDPKSELGIVNAKGRLRN